MVTYVIIYDLIIEYIIYLPNLFYVWEAELFVCC